MSHKYFFSAALSMALTVVLTLSATAQGVLTFTKTDFDFGKVAEGTLATHEFSFKNTGNQPIVIANVQASCGCTTPEWTKTPVMPGKTGFVKAAYNSAGRPGQFNKTVTITSNAAQPSMVLTIKGTVLTKDQLRPTYTAADLARSPKLVLDRTTHDFGKMEAGQQPVARFTVKNTGKSDLVLAGLTSSCYCVSLKSVPAPIKPGQSATVELQYGQRQLGQLNDVVTINSNDIASPDAKVTLKANVVQSLTQRSMLKEGDAAVPFK